LCPQPSGPDFDFGQGPALFTVNTAKGRPRDLLGAGEKSGVYWALDPSTGAVVWSTQAGPGGIGGGLQWGSSTDGSRIYVSDANTEKKAWTLVNSRNSTTTTTGGIWSALDAATGQILWQTADPTGAKDGGAVTAANGVVYVGSLAPTVTVGNTTIVPNTMYALNAATGAILWAFQSGGSVNSGAAVANGVVYWGSGYGNFGAGTANNKLYAFTAPYRAYRPGAQANRPAEGSDAPSR
jgi:polyvinyl alcohol dehydrogenase (cytochrome)